MHVKWEAGFNTGRPAIDEQHRELFKLYNLVCDACQRCEGDDVVRAAVEALFRYTEIHFRDEEALLESSSSPDLDQQRAQHNQIKTELKSLTRGGNLSCKDVQQWIVGRLIPHIKFSDIPSMSRDD